MASRLISILKVFAPALFFLAGVFFNSQFLRLSSRPEKPPPITTPARPSGWTNTTVSSSTASDGAPKPGALATEQENRRQLSKRLLGEAVLESDVPQLRRLREASVAKSIEYAMRTKGSEYEALFKRYGFDDDTTKRMMGHVEVLYEARAIAQAKAGELNSAQMAYEREMRSLLGNAYPEYQAYEVKESARRQLDNYQAFAASTGVSLDEGEKLLLGDLIHESAAYTGPVTMGTGGVFQNFTLPSYGDRTRAMAGVQAEFLEKRVEGLLSQMEQRGFSLEIRRSVEAFYAKAVGELRDLSQGVSPGALLSKKLLEEDVALEAARLKARVKSQK